LLRTANDPIARRLVDGAIQAAERGATLTKRMLAFARRQELRPEAVNVAKLLSGMVEMLRRSLGPTIEIVMEFGDDLALIRVDPNQLELALLNLALNARDAMPRGGRLQIGAQNRSVEAGNPEQLESGRYVAIVVTDTGQGMDEITLRRAAEPFFTTKGVGKGTGLGLPMVYGLAAQSGGSARMSSQVGIGTTVELSFPIAEVPTAAEPQRAPLPSENASASYAILLVDDDPAVTAATAAMLEQLGHHVRTATSGAAALAVIDEMPTLDLVVTDHAMAGMTGMELADRIRHTRPDMPIVLATGYADVPIVDSADMLRLHKPYRLDRLAAAIALAMARSRRGTADARMALATARGG
jgi:CheY-like chemotaxis protein